MSTRPRAARVRRLGRRIPALVALALLLAACATPPSPSPSAAPATPSSPPSTSPSTVSSPGPTAPVALDPSLLAILPATISGYTLAESPEAESAALADPQLAIVGTGMAAGIAVDPPTGEFVYAVVVRLRPGAMNDSVFRDWRDSFDQGACSQAGGTSGNAQAEIDGRTVYIGTCAGGVRTYHVWLADRQLLVSASSVGDRRFGEILMENLQP